MSDFSAAGPISAAAPVAILRSVPSVNLFGDLVRRLRRSRAWVGAQFWAIVCFIFAGIAWAAAPPQPAWLAGLFSLAPLVLAAAMLTLQAITMRSLMGEDGMRSELLCGVLALCAWSGAIAAVCVLFIWCERAVPLWAAWLSAHAPLHTTLLTPLRAERWLTDAVWALRWIVAPAVAVPCAVAAAQWGWRLPWRRVRRFLFDWRWWPAVILAALAGVALPGCLFAAEPHGPILHQLAALFLNLAAAYILAVGSWVLLLGWAAVLFSGMASPPRRVTARQPKPQTHLHPKAA